VQALPLRVAFAYRNFFPFAVFDSLGYNSGWTFFI
jgi:hypothetical protein